MIKITAWVLITIWSSGNTMIPMQSKEACVKAMQVHGNYCYNTETGEVIDQK